jgi:hypothetical protein
VVKISVQLSITPCIQGVSKFVNSEFRVLLGITSVVQIGKQKKSGQKRYIGLKVHSLKCVFLKYRLKSSVFIVIYGVDQRWPTRGTRATICPRLQYSREVKTFFLLFDSDETVGQGYIMHNHSEE